MNIRKNIVLRIVIVYLSVLLFAFAIIGRIIQLQFVEVRKWEDMAGTFSKKDIIIKPKRGDICALDGRLLSTSVPLYHVYFDTRVEALDEKEFYENIDSIAEGLSRILEDRTKSEYKRRLQSAFSQKRQLLLKRGASYVELRQMKELPIFRKGRYKGGFVANQEDKRIQPFGLLGSRTIGYTWEDVEGNKVGKVGLERAYETELKGKEGISLMQKLSGNVWMPLDEGNQVEAQDGYSIITTIDVDLQDLATESLLRCLDSNDAHHGSVILMEVATGEIRAIANLGRTKDGTYKEDYNYAIGESTEPGSTFKLASLIVALEDGYVSLDDSVDTERGVKKYYKSIMKDSHEGGYGIVSVQEAFELSSNVGISKIITKYYSNREQHFVDKLYAMNLNNKLGVEIIGEGQPKIKSPSDSLWSGVSLPWMSIGYGVHITPLQTLTFYNAIANGGKMVKPKFVREIRDGAKIVKHIDTEVLMPLICSNETVEKAQKLLKGVVEHGTATNIRNKNYTIAGKTGTAQLGYWNKGARKKHQASFAGYFPAENPKYSCIVVINSPEKGRIYGNVVAGPVFKEIADKVYAKSLDMQLSSDEEQIANNEEDGDMPPCRDGNKDELNYLLSQLGVEHDNVNTAEWVTAVATDSVMKYKQRSIDSDLVPFVVGMGLRDALFLLENTGLKVEIKGTGIVRRQSLRAGTRAAKGSRIIIELS